MNTKVHFFRDYHITASGKLFHSNDFGNHGADPRTCGACVNVAVAVITDDKGYTSVGIAYRHPDDQFNRKLGRLISTNRAQKNWDNKIFVNEESLALLIDTCYNCPTSNTNNYQTNRWKIWNMEDKR